MNLLAINTANKVMLLSYPVKRRGKQPISNLKAKRVRELKLEITETRGSCECQGDGDCSS